ncbi:MAG: DUF1573 domain-containing protein [Planctomycetota bacterium]
MLQFELLGIFVISLMLGTCAPPADTKANAAQAGATLPAPQVPGTPSRAQHDATKTPGRESMKMPVNPKPAEKPAPGKEPKLVFEREFHEFGSVDEGTELEALFPFRNEGMGDLVFVNMLMGCACSGIRIEVEGKLYNWNEPIAPGAKGIVYFIMRTTGFKDSKASDVYLHSNDPNRSGQSTQIPLSGGPTFGLVTLRVHANITKVFDFKPDNRVSIGSVLNLDATTRTIQFVNYKGAPFEILGFEPAQDPIVQLKAEPADATRSNWNINITIPAGQPLGSLTKAFTLKTEPSITGAAFFVLATIRGAIETNPAGLFAFGPIARGQAVMRQLTVTNHHPSATLKISNIRLLDPQDKLAIAGDKGAKLAEAQIRENVKITTIDTKPGKVAVINIEILASMPAGVFGCRLAFDSGVEGGPNVLTIPVSGYVR